jgi:hypothetical protein
VLRTVAPVGTAVALTIGARVVLISGLTLPFSSSKVGRIGGVSTVPGVCESMDFAMVVFARVNVLPRPNSLDGTEITPPAGTV